MKRFIVILTLCGLGAICAGLILLIFPFDPLSLQSTLASDGSFDPSITYAFAGLKSGMVLTGLVLLLLALILLLCERGVIPILKWDERRFIISIIAIKLILSVAYIAVAPYIPTMLDDTIYWQYSKSFANGDPILSPDGKPTSWWPIGYPLYLSIFFRIFGQHIWVGQLANVLILTGSIVMTYLVAYEMFGSRTARRAAIIMTIMPSQIFYTVILLSDILFAMLIITLVYLVQRPIKFTNSIILGIVLGMAVMTRATVLLFPLVAFIYWISKYKRFKSALIHVVIAGIMCELVLLPWQIRNYREFGGFTIATTNGGVHLWMGNNPSASGGYIYGDSYISHRAKSIMRNMTEIERDRYAYKQGLSYIFAHPIKTIALWPKKFFYLFSKDSRCVTWSFAGTYRQLNPTVLMAMVFITEIFFAALGLSFLVAVFPLLKSEGLSPRILLLCGTIFYFVGIYLLYIAEGRYHLPLIPIFAIIGMASVDKALDSIKSAES